jgi:hypothetical protein
LDSFFPRIAQHGAELADFVEAEEAPLLALGSAAPRPSGAGSRDRGARSAAACRNRASPNDDRSPENTEAVDE